ncbi:MAG: AI-2E family transporter [Thiotrichaceae bacterium]
MTTDTRWFWLALITVTFILLYLLAPILTPFIMGALLAYLGDPIVDRLEKFKLSRTLSVVIVFVILFIFLLIFFFLVIPVLETQLKALIHKLPEFIDWGLQQLQPYLKQDLDVDVSVLEIDRLKTMIGSHWNQAGGIIRALIAAISHSGMFVVAWIANILLTPVVAFYMLRDWDHFVDYIHDLLPRNAEPTISRLAKESDDVLGAFLRGQLLVMLSLAAIYTIGLWMVGVEFALLIGLFAGLLSFVPYLGLILGVVVAGLAVMFQTQDYMDLLLVFLVFGVAQMIESMLLTPMLVGERIGLHPVSVIFAVLAGGQLFGFFGVLLALPIAAILAVIMRHLHSSYKESHIYRI